jgi:hypothetical protein
MRGHDAMVTQRLGEFLQQSDFAGGIHQEGVGRNLSFEPSQNRQPTRTRRYDGFFAGTIRRINSTLQE